MENISLYDEASLIKQKNLQSDHAWDLETSIDWSQPIDINKPLVSLDENALFFPGISEEQRLAVSQAMGLVIVACICEMEDCLLRLKKECWEDVCDRYPTNPEFMALGEMFFAEEHKHTTAFHRYLMMFSHTLGVDGDTLKEILPTVAGTKSEYILRKNIQKGGQVFWWIVATVEQEFLHLYKCLHPFQKSLEPLYYALHRKHFEEEARHAAFPYLMLELLRSRSGSRFRPVRKWIQNKGDYVFSQLLLSTWTVDSLRRMKRLKRLKQVHSFFSVLSSVYPHFEKNSTSRMLWGVFTSVPYVSALINPFNHSKVVNYARGRGALSAPFPQPMPEVLVDY